MRLRQKISFKQYTQNSDGQGGFYESATGNNVIFADVREVSASKQSLYNQIYEGEIIEVTCRAKSVSNVKQGDYVFVWNNTDLVIHAKQEIGAPSIKNQQADRYVKFICSRKNG